MKIKKITEWKGISQSNISLGTYLVGLIYSIGWSLMIKNPLPFFIYCIVPYIITRLKLPVRKEYELHNVVKRCK